MKVLIYLFPTFLLGCAGVDRNACYSWKQTKMDVDRFNKKSKVVHFSNSLSSGQACYKEGAHLVVTRFAKHGDEVEFCYHWNFAGDDWRGSEPDSCTKGHIRPNIFDIDKVGQFTLKTNKKELSLIFKRVSVTYDTLENGIARSPVSFDRFYPISMEDSSITYVAEGILKTVGIYNQYLDT